MKLTEQQEKQIETMGGEALEVSDEAVNFSVGGTAFSIHYGTGCARKYVVNGNNWDDSAKSYTGSYRVAQTNTLSDAISACARA
jgi:hypothetical protein